MQKREEEEGEDENSTHHESFDEDASPSIPSIDKSNRTSELQMFTRPTMKALTEPLCKEGVQRFQNDLNAHSWLNSPTEFLAYIPESLNDIIGFQLKFLQDNSPFDVRNWREDIKSRNIEPVKFLQYLLKSFGGGSDDDSTLTLLAHSQSITLSIKDVKDPIALREWMSKWDIVLADESRRTGLAKEEVFSSQEQLNEAVANQIKKMKDHKLKSMNVFWQSYQDRHSKDPCSSFLDFIYRILDINHELQKVATKAISIGYLFDSSQSFRHPLAPKSSTQGSTKRSPISTVTASNPANRSKLSSSFDCHTEGGSRSFENTVLQL